MRRTKKIALNKCTECRKELSTKAGAGWNVREFQSFLIVRPII